MAGYVDLYVLPVPKNFIPAYRRMSAKMGKVMRKYGCLEYREFLGDDLHVKKMVSPLTMVKVKKGEVLVFAVTGFRSKSHRNQVLKRTMKDPIVKKMCQQAMPFDHKRMVYGGFTTIVKASLDPRLRGDDRHARGRRIPKQGAGVLVTPQDKRV